MSCEHVDFVCDIVVARMSEKEGGPVKNYMADVRIKCAVCGIPFRFIGLPAGMDINSPCVSVDATEGRFPIAPKGQVLSELEGTPIGFTIRKKQY